MVRIFQIILCTFTIFFFLGCKKRPKVKPENYLQTGYYYLKAREYSLALEYFFKAKRYKDDFDTNFLIAYTLYKQKNYKDALKFLNGALKFDEKNARGLILKGDIYLALNDLNRAKSYYFQIIKNKDYPNYYLAYYKLGLIYLKNNQIDQAKKYFLLSYYNNPYYVAPQKELIKIYLKKNNLKKAKKFLKNLLILVPNDKEVKKLKREIESRERQIENKRETKMLTL